MFTMIREAFKKAYFGGEFMKVVKNGVIVEQNKLFFSIRKAPPYFPERVTKKQKKIEIRLLKFLKRGRVKGQTEF